MSKQANSLTAYLILALTSVTLPVYGAQWTTSAGVAPAVTYTDNVCQASDNEQGEWIALVTPDVSIAADGQRANMNLTAAVEINSLTDDRIEELGCNPQGFGDRQQFSPSMNASADAILVQNWFYFDASARVSQNAVSPFVAGGGDLNTNGNTNTTTNYTLSPYVTHRFKNVADLQLRYTWDEQFNTSDAVRDSTEEAVALTFASDPAAASFFWGVQADYSEVKYGNGVLNVRDAQPSELTSAQLNLGYQLSRKWQINGFYGQEENDFVSLSDEIDGEFWDVGLRWTPNARTVVEAGSGNRFYGNSPRFSITHEYKHSNFNASYVRTLTYDRNIRSLDSGIAAPTTISTSPMLDDRFTLGYAYNWRRATLNVNGNYSEQKRTDTLSEQTFKSVSVSLNRSLSRQFSVNGSVGWSEGEPTGGRVGVTSAYEIWQGTVGVQRTINGNTNLSLDYQFTDRQSDQSGGFNSTYTENRITLSIQFRI